MEPVLPSGRILIGLPAEDGKILIDPQRYNSQHH
jgi:hypothetical protein